MFRIWIHFELISYMVWGIGCSITVPCEYLFVLAQVFRNFIVFLGKFPFFCFVLFLNKVLLCSSGWPWVHFGYIAWTQAGLKLTAALLPQPFGCWHYRHVPQHSAWKYFWKDTFFWVLPLAVLVSEIRVSQASIMKLHSDWTLQKVHLEIELCILGLAFAEVLGLWDAELEPQIPFRSLCGHLFHGLSV